ncbi:hypothetical protein N9854_06405 [Amylibacter sp.]|nr:hypothetical protein [Amylibacter sp.]
MNANYGIEIIDLLLEAGYVVHYLDENYCSITNEFDSNNLEIGLIIPFGKQPAAGPRQWAREFQPYFTDF